MDIRHVNLAGFASSLSHTMSSPSKSNTAMIEAPVTEPIPSDEEDVIDVNALEKEAHHQMQARVAVVKAINDEITKKKKAKEDQLKEEQKKAEEEAEAKWIANVKVKAEAKVKWVTDNV